MIRQNAHDPGSSRAPLNGAVVVLLMHCAGCSLSAAFLDTALGGDGGDGDGDEATCTYDPELIPVCPDNGYAEVCDTLGAVVSDGEDGIPRYACVPPSEATVGPCDGEIGRLDPNVQSELRILHGIFLFAPETVPVVGQCFRGRILVMPADESEASELMALSEVETAVDDSGLGAVNEMRIGIVDERNARSEFTSSTGQAAIELRFCVPDPTTQGSPTALAAMVRLSSGVTSSPRCLDGI